MTREHAEYQVAHSSGAETMAAMSVNIDYTKLFAVIVAALLTAVSILFIVGIFIMQLALRSFEQSMTLMMHPNDTIPAAVVKSSLTGLQASSTNQSHHLQAGNEGCVFPADNGATVDKPKSDNQH
jgi:hypothetical protein